MREITDSGIIGTKEFVAANYHRFKDLFMSKKDKIPRPVAGLDGIFSLKRLADSWFDIIPYYRSDKYIRLKRPFKSAIKVLYKRPFKGDSTMLTKIHADYAVSITELKII